MLLSLKRAKSLATRCRLVATSTRAYHGRVPRSWTSSPTRRKQTRRRQRASAYPAPRSLASASSAADEDTSSSSSEIGKPQSLWSRIAEGVWPQPMSKKAITLSNPGPWDRWIHGVLPSVLLHVPIGSVYAWSMWNAPLTSALGVVAPASQDWTLSATMPVFSLTAATLGATTFFLGPWQERAGPRLVAAVAGVSYASACAITGLGVHLHSLPLCFAGYGLLGGLGWGLGYLSPVSTMMRWFPERKGLATGLTLTAFGTGAAFAAPIIQDMCARFYTAPTYLGAAADLGERLTTSENGVQFVQQANGALAEVVVATAKDLAALPGGVGAALQEGVYLVGTGSTGAAEAFASLGLVYGAMTLASSALFRVPAEGWAPAGSAAAVADTPAAAPAAAVASTAASAPRVPLERSTSIAVAPQGDVDYNQCFKTPQFYGMWAIVLGNAFSGMTLITSAKTMMGDIFGTLNPAVVTGAFATSFVGALSMANAGGRLGWAITSDFVGRRNTYYIFGLGAPIVAAIPLVVDKVVADPTSTAALFAFYGGTLAAVSFYGGLFSCLPAYIADVFGSKYMGSIHGRVVTAWSVAAMTGPNLLAYFRTTAYNEAAQDLAESISAQDFQAAFGAPKAELETLLGAKTVTLPRLLELAPPGTVDPTPFLYNSTCYSICGMIGIATLANFAMRPVDAKHFSQNIELEKKLAIQSGGLSAEDEDGGREQQQQR